MGGNERSPVTQRMSNTERIQKAAAEAEAAALQKASRKAAPRAPAKPRTPTARPKARIKVVWAVGRPGLEPVKTYPYIDRSEADAEAARRGNDFRVVPLKVPMES
jgi:hypothetical protein